MKNVWKKILATVMAAMMITATVQAATANRIDGENKLVYTFYGNDDTTVNHPVYEESAAWEKVELQDAPLGGKAIKIEVPGSGAWECKKLDFAESGDLTSYKEDGYFGMWMKVVTDADEYAFRWNFWEHPDESTWRYISTERDNNGEVINNTDYLNKWAFVSMKISDMKLNPDAVFKKVYESAMQFTFTSKAATVYVQGLGIYAPEMSSETVGLSAKLSWQAVEGADHYIIKRDTNLSGSFADVVTSSCTDTTFTDSTVPAEGLYRYAILAYNGETRLDKKTLYANVIGENLERAVAYYTNESAIATDTNGQFACVADSDVPLGGCSLKPTNTRSALWPVEHDLSNYWQDGYLGFYFYTENTEYNHIEIKNSGNNAYKMATYNIPQASIKANQWQFVKIKLTDFTIDDGFRYDMMQPVLFDRGQSDGGRKIQGLGIYMPTSPSVTLTSSVSGGSVTLNWNTKLATPAKYEIYRDGTRLCETTVATYTDTPSQDAVHYYTVKALDAENNVICEKEKIVGILDASADEVVSVYTNTNNASYINNSSYSQNDSPHGGYYVAKNAGAAETAIGLNNSDWSAAKDTDYLTFWYYTDIQQQFMLEIYTDGWKYNSVNIDASNANAGKWNLAKVKFGDITKATDADFSKVIQVKLAGDQFLSSTVAWQGVKIVSGPKTVSVTSMNIISNDTDDTPEYTANEELAITATVENGTSAQVTPALIAACYDGGKLVDCKIVKKTTSIDGGKSGDVSGTYTIPSNVTKPIVKIMVWDSAEGMKPYSQPYGNSK